MATANPISKIVAKKSCRNRTGCFEGIQVSDRELQRPGSVPYERKQHSDPGGPGQKMQSTSVDGLSRATVHVGGLSRESFARDYPIREEACWPVVDF